MNDTPSIPGPLTSQPKQGLSVTSFVLGMLSVLACTGLTGIPAIITGHIARARARRDPLTHGGAGLALAGLILGYVGTALTVVVIGLAAAIALPAMAKAKSQAQSGACMNNMKQIALGARMWSNDHNEVFPPDFASMSKELNTPRILVCPGDGLKTAAQSWSAFSPADNVSYEFVAPNLKEADVTDASQTEVFRCPIHGHAAMADGSVRGSRRR